MPHTPGPWIAKPFLTPERDDDPMMVYQVEAGDLQERFDNLRTDENDEYNEDEVAAIHNENEANATLLAAAPELLAALKEIKRVSGIGYIGRLADDAIAKAEGRQP